MSNALDTTPLKINWHNEFSYPTGSGGASEDAIKRVVDEYLSGDAPIAQDVRALKEHAIVDSSYPNT